MSGLNYGQNMQEAILNCLAAHGGKLDRSTLWVKIGSRYGRDALKKLRRQGLIESAGKQLSFAITKEGQGRPEFLDRQVTVSVVRLTTDGWAAARGRETGEPITSTGSEHDSDLIHHRPGGPQQHAIGSKSIAAAPNAVAAANGSLFPPDDGEDNAESLSKDKTRGFVEAAEIEEPSLGDVSTVGDIGSSIADEVESGVNDVSGLEVVDLSSRYEILETLGRGGMGEVYKARDNQLNRFVAIKRLLEKSIGSQTANDRFLTEARSVAALHHFNIVQIFDTGRDANGPFLILEYVDGQSLIQKLRHGPPKVDEACEIICQLCDALEKAHERGVIHRDITPSNILLTLDGEPKLTDFGLARQVDGDRGNTSPGAVLGTLDYMPPEQRQDATTADARSDLWSLAATLYQMLTGRNPRVIRLDEVPLAFQDVLRKALEDPPAKRFQTATEFKQAIRQAGQATKSPAGHAPHASDGKCPRCGADNDPTRKFCRSCAGDLRVDCFFCGETVPIWDDVCGECGSRQSAHLHEFRQSLEETLQRSESLSHDYRFQEAIAALEQDFGEKTRDPRVADLFEKAQRLQVQLRADWGKLQSECEAAFADAQRLFEDHKHEAAIESLYSVPEQLHTARMIELGKTCDQARQEIFELKSVIQQRKQQNELDDLEQLTARVLELQPREAAVKQLHKQLMKRNQLLESTLAQAQAEFDQFDDKRTIELLESLGDNNGNSKDVKKLRAAAERRRAEASALAAGIRAEAKNLNLKHLLPLVDRYMEIRPNNSRVAELQEQLRAKRNSIHHKLMQKAEIAFELHDDARTLAILDHLHEQSGGFAFADALDLQSRALSRQHEAKELVSEIDRAVERNDLDGLLPSVRRLQDIRPQFSKRLDGLERQLASRESTAKMKNLSQPIGEWIAGFVILAIILFLLVWMQR